VRVIVDANIVFSGILNSDGKIGDLLINSGKFLNLIAPDFLRVEISKHHDKLCKISGLSSDQIREAEFQIFKNITFISEEQINEDAWVRAAMLTSEIDPNDTPYVAFSSHFRCKIWSGDKKLISGLRKKGFNNLITTDELFEWRKEKEEVK
jgi:predicted nucleic acid-binding protein